MVVGFASGELPDVPLNQVLLNDRAVIGIDWDLWARRRPAEHAALLAELFALAADGRIRPAEPTAYPLDQAARALDDLEQRRVAGKVVLAPQAVTQATRASQLLLEHLAVGVARQRVDELELLGALLHREAEAAAVLGQRLRCVGGSASGRGDHERAHPLAGPRGRVPRPRRRRRPPGAGRARPRSRAPRCSRRCG